MRESGQVERENGVVWGTRLSILVRKTHCNMVEHGTNADTDIDVHTYLTLIHGPSLRTRDSAQEAGNNSSLDGTTPAW